MSDIPKFVKTRLRDGRLAGDHPDANLLAALAEQTLRPGERQDLLRHLATCGDCREVFALAVPQLIPAAALPSRVAWFRWPVLRWAAVAACVVVVGTAVSLRFGRQAVLKPAAERAELKSAPQQNPAPANAESPAPQDKLAALQSQPAAPPAREPAPALAKRLDRRPMADRSMADAGVARNQPASPMSPAAAPAPAPQPREERVAGILTPAAPAVANEVSADKKADRDQLAEAITGKAKDEQQEAKPSAKQNPAIGTLAHAMKTAPKGQALFRNQVGAPPQWRISSAGALERSSDEGQNWQAVPVAGNQGFRAVASVASDVWVGGAAGALFHSADGGQHWMQLTPTADGKTLSADIIAIAASGPQRLTLSASNGELWVTTDAGLSWQKH